MYSLKSWYNGPYLFLTVASHDISHVHLYLVTHFPLHHVYICQTTSLPYYFYSNITNVNATYSHQRPPSVGMPRHAFRRRIPSIRVSAVAARCRDFLFVWGRCALLGRVPGALRCLWFSNFGISTRWERSRELSIRFG